MSVSDRPPAAPRPRPTETTYPGAPTGAPIGPRRGGPGGKRPGQRRGVWALVIVVLLAAIAIAWILTHQAAPAKPGQAGGGGPGGPGGGFGGPGGGGGGRGGGRGGAGGAGGITSVNAAKASIADVPVYVTALGTVTPAATVTVRTQLAGQLFSVSFHEGQMVTKGQTLAQVDPRPYQQALLQAQGTLARDQAILANVKVDLQRYETLLAQDSIARQTVDTQRALVRQDEGVIKTDQANVAAAQLNLNYTRIVAPVSGRTGLRQVDPGNYVSNGDANGIVTITQVNPIDVVFTVPEDQIGSVVKGVHAGDVPVTVFDRDQSAALAEGKLLTLDNQIDSTTGTVKAKARFQNAGDSLFPNQFVNVRVLVSTMKNAVVVPTSAILRGQNGLFVYTVDAGRAVHMTTVTIGPVSGENTSILSGLQAGATVVTDGSDRLREGGRVILPGDCAPTGGAAGGGGGRRGGGGAAGGAPGAAGAPGAPAATEKKDEGNWFTNFFSGLFGGKKEEAKPAGAGAGRQGVGPDGQKCTPVNFAAGGGGGAGGQDARTNAMLDQLGLSPDQRAKIDKIRADNRAKMTAAFQSGDMDTARALRQQTATEMEAVMNPQQKAKYEQLRAEAQAQAAANGGGFGGGGAPGGGAPGAPAPGGSAPGAPAAGGAAPAGGGRSTTSTSTTTTSTTSTGPAAGRGGAAAGAPGGGRGAGGAPGGGGPGGGGNRMAMYAEAGVSAAQQAKIEAISAEYRPKIQAAMAGGDREAARPIFMEMRAKIDAILTPDQRAKIAAARAARGGGGGGPQ